MKRLTIESLSQEAAKFAKHESNHSEPSLYGVTDGKAVGTYLEHKFILHLREEYYFPVSNSAEGIDFSELGVDLKVTSIKQPQSSCPFKSARQKICCTIRFSIFGVGKYSFIPWKVAISGLYKNLKFRVIGPFDGKPVVFDDTCYFLPCSSEEGACLIQELLESSLCQEIFESLIFWDSKRPVTSEVLNMINLSALARLLQLSHAFDQAFGELSLSEQEILF